MKMTAWFFCSLLLVSVSLAQAEAPKTEETTAASSDAADVEEEMTAVERGKQLHDQNCLRCHGTKPYTRRHRRIKTYAGLINHVQRCATNLNKQWWEDEVADVAEYLDVEFYFFGMPKK